MNAKKNLILILVLAALVGVTFLTRNQKGTKDSSSGVSPGDLLVKDLDLSTVQRITIAGPGGTSTVASVEGQWVVESMYNYPVKFETLTELTDKLADLKVGQVVANPGDDLNLFGLGTNQTTIALAGEGGKEAATFVLGENRENGGGRFALAGGKDVVLVEEDFFALPSSGNDWIDEKLLDLTPEGITTVTITPTEGSPYTLLISNGNNYAIPGLAKNEEVNNANAGRVARALQYFNLSAVIDPAKPDTETGLDKPLTYHATTKKGIDYTVKIGGKVESGDRYAKIGVTFNQRPAPTRETAEGLVGPKPEDQSDEDRAKAIDAQLSLLMDEYRTKLTESQEEVDKVSKRSNWIYLISSYTADSMMLARTNLVNVKAEEKKQEPALGPIPPAPGSTGTEPVTPPPTIPVLNPAGSPEPAEPLIPEPPKPPAPVDVPEVPAPKPPADPAETEPKSAPEPAEKKASEPEKPVESETTVKKVEEKEAAPPGENPQEKAPAKTEKESETPKKSTENGEEPPAKSEPTP